MQLSDKTIEELALELNQIPLFGDIHPRTLLRRVPFFEGVPDNVLDDLGHSTVLRTFREGEFVCKQGEYEESFYLILQGRVEVSVRTKENPHIPLATLSKGDFFGELGPLTGGPRTATITTLERTILLEILRDAFLKLHKDIPTIRKRIDDVYMERSLSTQLRRVSLFSELPDDVLGAIKERVEILDFERDEPILKQGDPGDSLYLIRYGFVKVSAGNGDKERILAYLKDGNYFGEMSLLAGGPRTANVTAVTKVEAVRIGTQVFQDILDKFPGVRGKLEATIAAREAQTRDIISNEDKARAMKFAVDMGVAQAAKVLVIELDKCVRCHCCVRACAYTHEGYARIERRGHRFHNILLPTTCMHCTDPECMLCPHGGIFRDKSGEIHHTVQCINCGACAKRCPYGNILVVEPEVDEKLYRGIGEYIREFMANRRKKDTEAPVPLPRGEAKNERRVVKCDMCADQPIVACVYNCPVNACRIISPEEFIELSSKYKT